MSLMGANVYPHERQLFGISVMVIALTWTHLLNSHCFIIRGQFFALLCWACSFSYLYLQVKLILCNFDRCLLQWDVLIFWQVVHIAHDMIILKIITEEFTKILINPSMFGCQLLSFGLRYEKMMTFLNMPNTIMRYISKGSFT